jgi:poly-beta-1,6-N-acetyl-D-glucosamine synthase
MKVAFWLSTLLVFYTYLGYAGWLWIVSRIHPKPLPQGAYLPFVSVIMIVRDEENTLPGKLQNLAALDYPKDRMEFVIVSDGSRDSTDRILCEAQRDRRCHTLTFSEARGKAHGLNSALQIAKGEIVLFVDARQEIEPDALRILMENFAQDSVGCVSGELMLGDAASGETEKGMGIYWRIEKKIRELESASGSVVGATGALYAARRALLLPIPADTILDDVLLPLLIARQGARVVFDPRARAWDRADLGAGREFGRKVRTLTGNYQLLQIAPWLVGRENPLRFRLLSHKLLRLMVPFALAMMLVTSLAVPQPFYLAVFICQLTFYALGLFALFDMKPGPLARVANGVFTLIVLNTAALVAFSNFVTGRKQVWVR